MPADGSHLICKKHEEETIYCTIEKRWVCLACEMEKGSKSWQDIEILEMQSFP